MRVVVTGSTGRLGRALLDACAAAGHEVTGLARSSRVPCDLTDRASVHQRIAAADPDLVVHAAGATDVDGCERDPDLAELLNVTATRHVVDAAAAAGAHLIYVSTNHVFDGTADEPYRESDDPNPRSVYGATKLAGEQLAGPHATVARTAWLWSPTGSGLVPTIIAAAEGSGPLRFADDEIAQPTAAPDLAEALLRLGEGRIEGCFHAVGAGAVSSFELAREVLAELGGDPARVEAIEGASLPGRIARRPRNGALDTGRLTATGGGLPHHLAPIRTLIRGRRTRA